MKFTLAWLKEHLDTDHALGEITDKLTMIGLEVEGVEDMGQQLAPFTIARVVEARQHPNADRLRVCMVDTGAGDPVQVVCGAPNARAGMKGVFVPPGAFIPGKAVTLSVGTIRGVESRGKLCSEFELELSNDHDGIIELPPDAPLGVPYAQWAGLDDRSEEHTSELQSQFHLVCRLLLEKKKNHIVWDRLFLLKQHGVTLFLTTHSIDEAEHLCFFF